MKHTCVDDLWDNFPSDNSLGGGAKISIFPTKILLATDGSEEAQLAALTAADLAKSTGSELQVVIILPRNRLRTSLLRSAFPEGCRATSTASPGGDPESIA
jgi:hypothetical protein